MGRYKDDGYGGAVVTDDPASLIGPESPPQVGTLWDADGRWMDSTPCESPAVRFVIQSPSLDPYEYKLDLRCCRKTRGRADGVGARFVV